MEVVEVGQTSLCHPTAFVCVDEAGQTSLCHPTAFVEVVEVGQTSLCHPTAFVEVVKLDRLLSRPQGVLNQHWKRFRNDCEKLLIMCAVCIRPVFLFKSLFSSALVSGEQRNGMFVLV